MAEERPGQDLVCLCPYHQHPRKSVRTVMMSQGRMWWRNWRCDALGVLVLLCGQDRWPYQGSPSQPTQRQGVLKEVTHCPFLVWDQHMDSRSARYLHWYWQLESGLHIFWAASLSLQCSISTLPMCFCRGFAFCSSLYNYYWLICSGN